MLSPIGKSHLNAPSSGSRKRSSSAFSGDFFASIGTRNSLPKQGKMAKASGAQSQTSGLLTAASPAYRSGNDSRQAPPNSAGSTVNRPSTDWKPESPTQESITRRSNIDSRVDTLDHTPEKSSRTSTSRFMVPRRAAMPVKTVLKASLPASSYSSPQRSSSYSQFRSSENFGLRNLGNTCYLNAVMQALNSLTEFVEALKRMPETVPPAASGELFRCTVETLAQMSSSAALSGPLSPAKLRERIASTSPVFGGSEQQDAHEFFLEYVNQLHDELLVARTAWLDGDGSAQRGHEEALVVSTQQFFDSEVQKWLLCAGCDQVNEMRERFRDFSLDIPASVADVGPCRLQDMLAAYFAPEELELKCEKCPGTRARMEACLASAPRVLVLHLKRFVPNIVQQRYDKQHQHVNFPVTLDLRSCLRDSVAVAAQSPGRLPARPLAAEAAGRQLLPPLPPPAEAPPPTGEDDEEEDEQEQLQQQRQLQKPQEEKRVDEPSEKAKFEVPAPLYDLRSIVAHDGGSPDSGHYVCYAQRERGGVWRCYDDAYVQELPSLKDPQVELGRKAYMLFYVQRC